MRFNYCENMKNITVSLDDETYRRARVAAAEAGRSVSAVVRDHLHSYIAESNQARRKKSLKELYAEIDARPRNGRAADRLSREELYDEATSPTKC